MYSAEGLLGRVEAEYTLVTGFEHMRQGMGTGKTVYIVHPATSHTLHRVTLWDNVNAPPTRKIQVRYLGLKTLEKVSAPKFLCATPNSFWYRKELANVLH